MLTNYLKVALRHLGRNKIYLAINTFGMGLSIACAMTAYLLVAYNIEFDDSMDAELIRNTVKVIHHRKNSDQDTFKELVAPISLAPAAANDIAGIKNFSRFCSDGGYMTYKDNGFHETIFFADSAFLQMFKPTLVSGSYKNFNDRNSIFISETFAIKYFGSEDPVGKEIMIQINTRQVQAIVGGVLKNVPFNSTFVENALMRIENYLDIHQVHDNDWVVADNASTLFELHDIRQANTISSQLDKYVTLKNAADPEVHSVNFELIPFSEPVSPNDVRQSDLHLRIPNIALSIFMILGGIILLIACFNLTNTTLALSMKRLKEIGVRKVVGSGRMQIAIQFMLEITVTVGIAVIVGFAMALFLIPQFASMWHLAYGLPELNRMNILIALMILLFTCALMAGIYPAVFGSRMNPILLFKGGKRAGGTNFFTRSLLVSQFSLSIIVLIAGVVFTQNAAYQDSFDFGYDKDRIITALIQGPQEATALANAIASNPNIERSAPSASHFAFINGYNHPGKIGSDKFVANLYSVSPGYFETVGLKLTSGNLFNDRDTLERSSVIVDENFVRRHQLTEPLGTRLDIDDKSYTVVGVVSNHITDLESDNTEDYVYSLASPKDYQILVIRAEASSLGETKKYIDKTWKELFPGKPLRTDTQNEILYLEANEYNHNLSKIFVFLTILGCLLSVSGLYSMASLNIHRRLKEIGVRKVLGATMTNILRLINIEFSIILLIAAVIGGWGGYTLTNALLNNLYDQHISVGIPTVILSGLGIFAVGIVATSATIWKAAGANPVESLKSI